MKNNHTHLTRLAAISLVVVMCLSSLAVLAPPAAASLQATGSAWLDNDTEVTGWLDLFNYDAEKDLALSHPFPTTWTNPNFTVETVYSGPEYGNVLHLERTGPVAMGGLHTAYLGHDLNGVFKIQFDFRVTTVDPSNGVTYFTIRLGSSPGTPDSNGAEWQIGTVSRNVILRNQAAGVLEPDTWYHAESIVDMINGTITDYLDGVHRETREFTGDGPPPHYSYMTILQYPNNPEVARVVGVDLDNIRISVPAHTVQPIASADGSSSLSITFDDGFANTYNVAKPILGDMPAAVAVTTSWIGNGSGWMTWAQVRELHDRGWEILGHGTDHTDMPTLTEAELHAEFAATRDAIAEHTGIQVRGWVYPHQANNEATDAVGWQYYEYLAHTTRDMTRIPIYSTNYGDVTLIDRLKPALLYGKNAHISVYTHQIRDGSATGNTDVQTFTEFVQWLRDNEINVVTPYEGYIPYRNAAMAQVSGDATEFSIGYGQTHNYATSDVYVRISGYADGDYVVCRSDGEYTHATSVDGEMICQLDAGEYTVMTLADFRQEQVDRAFGPLYAIIPVVVMLAVIGSLITMVGRLKF